MIILKKPIVTEKTIRAYNEDNKVTFEVSLDADKNLAKNEIEEIFDVKVLKVNVINRLGKLGQDRFRRKTIRKKQDAKLMIFTLNEGDKIDIFESNK